MEGCINYQSTRVRRMSRSASAQDGEVMGSMLGHGKPSTWYSGSVLMLGLGLNGRAKLRHKEDVKICTFYCYVVCVTLLVQLGDWLGPKQAQFITMHS